MTACACCGSCSARYCVTRESRMLVVAEILRWVVLVVPLYLGVWRYAEIRGYTIFVDGAEVKTQFWGIVSAIIFGAYLLLYLPVKLVTLKRRLKKGTIEESIWRPSIVTYIILSATPVLLMIVIAATKEGQDDMYMDPVTVLVLQVTVLGLTLTEWISKLREEHLTFDLVGAMSSDFFFAYDVIDFITMATHEDEIYHSIWVYICFGFSFVAMFKYVPTQPMSITGESGPRLQVAILVSMFCSDIPFVIIRLWTMIEFDFRVSDLIHPIKNIALIVFGIMQLSIIHCHKDDPEPPTDVTDGLVPALVPQTRRIRKEGGVAEVTPAERGWDFIRRRVLRSVQESEGGLPGDTETDRVRGTGGNTTGSPGTTNKTFQNDIALDELSNYGESGETSNTNQDSRPRAS